MVEKKWVWIIDVAIQRRQNRRERTEKDQQIPRSKDRNRKTVGKQATVVPVVIVSLGAIARDLKKHLRTICLESISPSQLQKTVLQGTAHILRKYL